MSSVKLSGPLFAAGAAMLLWTASAVPASAAVPTSAAKAPVSFVNLLGGSCSPGVYFTQTSGSAVTVDSYIYCYSSIDYIQVDVQLRRNGGIVSSNSCGTTSWSISCPTGVVCQPGSYQASAQFQAYSTSGNGDYESWSTPVVNVTC
ncbi:hypothetical protein J5X84_04100 [Streptosporangiaceae bacterium NEAU-GS5]|nr:hypothetical protein [Streptosporangiaceae bacterium NEAU-GS5]